MNGLSKGLQKHGFAPTYRDAVQRALSCHILLIGVEYPLNENELMARKQRINKLEVVLQKCMQPAFNKRPNPYKGTEILSSLV